MQEKMEKNIWGLLIVLAIALSVGGIVEIVPLFTMSSTFEHNKFPEIVWQRQAGQTLADHKAGDGIRPYNCAGTGRPGHLPKGRVLSLPLTDDPSVP